MQPLPLLKREDFKLLIRQLQKSGFRCIGPQLRDGAIVYDDLSNAKELPLGLTDAQSPSKYQIKPSDSPRYFNWANGPQALKPLTFTPREVLWRSSRNKEGQLSFSTNKAEAPATAVIGVRACDLTALALQRQHFLSKHEDQSFKTHNDALFLVAVHCNHPADTCFCASTGDGPKAEKDFDIALYELDEGFLLETGSDAGEKIAKQLPLSKSSGDQREAAENELLEAAKVQTRTLPSRNMKDNLFAQLHHKRWNEIARRCLSCGNCTAVCPTCFCHSESDLASLDGANSEHLREWDSCFNEGHSYIHGLVIRADTQKRYRQWMTHKLGSWHEQYGRSGCVGCGRCISWCPAGIDITEEAHAIVGT